MLRKFILVCALTGAALVTACGGGDEDSAGGPQPATTETAGFACDPADANRPDKPRRQEVAGVVAAAVPRRTCTVPQRGCVAVSADGDVVAPPAPGIDVARVTKTWIDLVYDVGIDLEQCQPTRLSVTVRNTVSSLPTAGSDDYPVSGRTGQVRVKLLQIPGAPDEGPPDLLVASSYTDNGLRSSTASIGLPPPEGGRRLTDAEVRRIEARREACQGNINDRTTCRRHGALHPLSGPVTAATPAELTRSVRRSLEANGGMTVLRLKCVAGTRCDAAFDVSGRRLEMSYRVQALKGTPTCWEVTKWSVIRPVPALGGFAAPIPSRGCVDR